MASSSSSVSAPKAATQCHVCDVMLRATTTCTCCGKQTCGLRMHKGAPPFAGNRCVASSVNEPRHAAAGRAVRRAAAQDRSQSEARQSWPEPGKAELQPKPKAWPVRPDAPTLMPRLGDPPLPEVAMDELPMPKHAPLSARDVADSYLEPDRLPISLPEGPEGYLRPDVKIREVVRVAAAPLPVHLNMSDLEAVGLFGATIAKGNECA